MNDIKITCSDNSVITGTIFGTKANLRGAIMIAPATGIKRRFYNSFATFLADNGFGVITFENQGIGDSKTGNLKNSKASLVSWGRIDMSAMFATLKANFPNTNYHLIGHSAGGQLVGLMYGATELTSICNVACSSGSIRNMKYPFKLTAKFFMNCFIPFNNFLFGYTNSQWIGMGEPLPKQVAQQWAEWCNSSGYIKNYLDSTNTNHFYDELQCPSLWINSIDDNIANDKNVADMIRVFPNLKTTVKTLNPTDCKLNEIGHMKFFNKDCKKLWTIALDWLANK